MVSETRSPPVQETLTSKWRQWFTAGPMSQPSLPSRAQAACCDFGRLWIVTLVPRGSSGARSWLNTPKSWSCAESLGLILDLRSMSSVCTACGMRRHHKHFGKAESHPANVAMKD